MSVRGVVLSTSDSWQSMHLRSNTLMTVIASSPMGVKRGAGLISSSGTIIRFETGIGSLVGRKAKTTASPQNVTATTARTCMFRLKLPGLVPGDPLGFGFGLAITVRVAAIPVSRVRTTHGTIVSGFGFYQKFWWESGCLPNPETSFIN